MIIIFSRSRWSSNRPGLYDEPTRDEEENRVVYLNKYKR